MAIGRSSNGCGTEARDDYGIKDESTRGPVGDKDGEYRPEVVESRHL